MEEYDLLTKCLQWLQYSKKYNSEAQWYCSSGHNLSYIHFEHKSEGEREEKWERLWEIWNFTYKAGSIKGLKNIIVSSFYILLHYINLLKSIILVSVKNIFFYMYGLSTKYVMKKYFNWQLTNRKVENPIVASMFDLRW